MDIFKLLQTFGPMAGGGKPPLAGMLGNKARMGAVPAAGALGPVGGPRAMPTPIETFDPGPSSAAEAPPALAAPTGRGPLSFEGQGSLVPEKVGPAIDMGPLPTAKFVDKHSPRGPLERVGDFIGSDDGRGALFRASAAMLGGGNIGDAMMAGAGHMDRKKKERTEQERYDRDEGQQDRQLDISQQGADTSALSAAGTIANNNRRFALDTATLNEAIRKNQAGELLTAAEHAMLQEYRAAQIATTQRGQDITAATAVRGQDVSAATQRRGQDITASTTMRGQDLTATDQELDRRQAGGQTVTTVDYDADGNPVEKATVRVPDMTGALYDPVTRQSYVRGPLGQPIAVNPSRLTSRSPLGR